MAEQTSNEPTKPILSKKFPNILRSINPLRALRTNTATQDAVNFDEQAKLYLQEQIKVKEIREKLGAWESSIRPELEQRSINFGLNPHETSRIVSRMLISFEMELSSVRNPEEIKRLIANAKENIKYLPLTLTQKAILRMQEEIESTTSLSLMDLISRKLDGNITDVERLKLKLFIAKEGKVELGAHNPLDNENLNISLFGPQSMKEYSYTLHHEFTHLAFHALVPQAREKHMMERMLGQKDTYRPAVLFYQVVSAIDEACAHRATEILGNTRKPHFEGYSQKIKPKLFEQAYRVIEHVSVGKTLEEFDKVSIQLYRNFVSSWKEGSTEQDVLNAVYSFKNEANVHTTKIS